MTSWSNSIILVLSMILGETVNSFKKQNILEIS